jgi:dolichol-phosphate mannosyltransferase
MTVTTPELSIVVPVYRGRDLVGPLTAEIEEELARSDISYEIVLVDDGCPAGSWGAIVEMASTNSHIRGVRLSRNFGQQIAVSAGIAEARGERLVVMDCDLQNPPSAIPTIVARLRDGHDIVYTVSKTRNNGRDALTSRLFWFAMTTVFRVNIVPHQLMMRGMSRRFADIFVDYPEHTRTVAGISNDIGLKADVLEVENRTRASGKSSYNFLRRFNLMLHFVINMTDAPLNVIIYISLLVLMITMMASLVYLFNALFASVVSGFTTLILAIFFFGSLTTLILGIIGLYLANIYREVRRRPLFHVQERTPDEQ